VLENELARIIIEQAEENGLIHIPEYEKWDSVFFRLNHKTISFGVQYKLKLSLKSIVQCLLADRVDFKVVVFAEYPKNIDEYIIILNALKIIPIFVDTKNKETHIWIKSLVKYRWKNNNPLKIPEGKYEIEAGSKSPLTLTEKRIAIVKMELLIEKQGYAKYKDFLMVGLRVVPKSYFQKSERGYTIKRKTGWQHIRKGLEK
jgi:hypothetical protein